MSATEDLPGRSAARNVVFLAALLTAASLILSGFAALKVFDDAIEPEIEKRANLIGRSVRNEVENALQIGIPFNALAGIERYLSRVMEDFSEIERITLVDLDDAIVADVSRSPGGKPADIMRTDAQAGAENVIVSPMLNGNILVGKIVLQIDKNFVPSKMRNILLDVLVLGLIAVLLSFEMVIWTVSNTIGKPLDRVFILLREQASGGFGRIIGSEAAGPMMRVARRLSDRAVDLAERGGGEDRLSAIRKAYFSDVRLPLFLFSTATEISTAFLPVFAQDAGGPDWLNAEMIASLPLIAYLLAMVLVSPFSGAISRRFGPRTLFLSCVPLTALTLIGVGVAHSAAMIAIWHGAMALIYALATVACQDYALDAANRRESARAMGSYSFVILGGVFCGAALGGVLADRIGFQMTFFFAAALAVCSGVLGYFALNSRVRTDAAEPPAAAGIEPARTGNILSNRRLLALLACVSAPKNIAMSVFVWYITPLALAAEGASFADIGRVVMIYYLVPLFVMPLFARLADTRVGYTPFLIAGLGVSGLALGSLVFWNGFWAVMVAVTGLGLGHAMIDTTHYVQAKRIARDSGLRNADLSAMGALRLIERASAIVGLIIAAAVLQSMGYVQVTVAMGAVMLLAALGLAAVELGRGRG